LEKKVEFVEMTQNYQIRPTKTVYKWGLFSTAKKAAILGVGLLA